MYCRYREQPPRYPCRCQACYQSEINSCRCYQAGYSQGRENEQKNEVKTEPTQSNNANQPQTNETKKNVKRSKWAYWKSVNCSDGKVRFLKTNVCPIPRRGYSVQGEPNFEPYVYEKPTKQPPPNKKDENSTEQKKTEMESKKSSKNSKDDKEDRKKKRERDKKRHHSKIKVVCCCSHQPANNRPACCCHTSSPSVPCRYQRSVTENMCCKCQQQAQLAKLNKKKTSFDCIRQYTESGETKMVCKKKKKPSVRTEEYALLFEDETINPDSGPTQIIIVADPKCNDSPAIQLQPIDPFTPLPVCECNAKQNQNEEPLRRDSQNARTSFDEGNKSARPSLENSKKSVDEGNKSARASLENSKKSVDATPRNSLETDKKKKKK